MDGDRKYGFATKCLMPLPLISGSFFYIAKKIKFGHSNLQEFFLTTSFLYVLDNTTVETKINFMNKTNGFRDLILGLSRTSTLQQKSRSIYTQEAFKRDILYEIVQCRKYFRHMLSNMHYNNKQLHNREYFQHNTQYTLRYRRF